MQEKVPIFPEHLSTSRMKKGGSPGTAEQALSPRVPLPVGRVFHCSNREVHGHVDRGGSVGLAIDDIAV